MYPTLEVRWFLPGPLPPDVAAWFEGLGPEVEEEKRTDRYLIPASASEPGVKVRQGLLETKARTAAEGTARLAHGVEGHVEAFRKWSFPLRPTAPVPRAGWVAVAKARRVRRYRWADGRLEETADLPPTGCAVELGEVRLGERVWWTVCLEAFGAEAGVRHDELRATAAHVFRPPGAAGLDADRSEGYVGWLAREAG